MTTLSVAEFIQFAKKGMRFRFLSSEEDLQVENVYPEEGYLVARDVNPWSYTTEDGKVIISWMYLWQDPGKGGDRRIIAIKSQPRLIFPAGRRD